MKLLACLAAFAVAFCLCFPLAHGSVTCRNERGSPVDWWVIVKSAYLPDSSNSAAASGFGYTYADSDSSSFSTTIQRLDTNTKGALGSTLNQIYNGDSSQVGWLIYNDQTPDNKEHTSYGHTKGDMGFDSQGGFWLVHSVPRFPDAADGGSASYNYPAYAKDFGQSFICMSYDLNNLNAAAGGFLLNKPYVYSSNLPSSLANRLPNVQTVLGGHFITREAATNATSLKTKAGFNFLALSKNEKWDKDLWSALVSPVLQTDLLIETWMNGATSNKMPTFCKPQYPYNNINIRQVAVSSDVTWSETKDHSKWAVAPNAPIFCIGDINRQFSQAKRGGGAVCGKHPGMWSALRKLITTADSC